MPATAIARRIQRCIDAFDVDDFETALIHLFPALDSTARKRRNIGVGERIRLFVADQEELIGRISTSNFIYGNIYQGDENSPEVTFPIAIYNMARNPLMHEGQLDPRMKIEGDVLAINADKWLLPKSYAYALCIATMAARENANERGDTTGHISIRGDVWAYNDLWGAEDELRRRYMQPRNRPAPVQHNETILRYVVEPDKRQ